MKGFQSQKNATSCFGDMLFEAAGQYSVCFHLPSSTHAPKHWETINKVIFSLHTHPYFPKLPIAQSLDQLQWFARNFPDIFGFDRQISKPWHSFMTRDYQAAAKTCSSLWWSRSEAKEKEKSNTHETNTASKETMLVNKLRILSVSSIPKENKRTAHLKQSTEKYSDIFETPGIHESMLFKVTFFVFCHIDYCWSHIDL